MVQPKTPLTRNTTYRLTHQPHLPRFFSRVFQWLGIPSSPVLKFTLGWNTLVSKLTSSHWVKVWGKISKQKSMKFSKPMGEGNGKVGVTWRVTTFIWRQIWLTCHYLSRCRHLNSFDINLDMKLSYYKQTAVKLRCCSQNYRFVVSTCFTSKLIQVKLYNTSFSRPLTNNLQQMVAFNKSGAIFHQPRFPVSCNKETCPLPFHHHLVPFGRVRSSPEVQHKDNWLNTRFSAESVHPHTVTPDKRVDE